LGQVIDQTLNLLGGQFIFSRFSCRGLTIRAMEVAVIGSQPLDKGKRFKEPKPLEKEAEMALQLVDSFQVRAIEKGNLEYAVFKNIYHLDSFPIHS